MNITSLSQQLNVSVKELRQRMSEAGFKVSPRARKIDNVLANQIIEKLQPKKIKTEAEKAVDIKKPVKIGPVIAVRDFAVALNLPVTEVIKTLIQNGVIASLNEQIDHDTAAVVGEELGFEILEDKQENLGVGTVAEILAKEKEEDLIERPPIVAVMGHVDHGKTKLLDTIRKTNIVDTEAGAITQHIGAYQVKFKEKTITFLDTPGHESFAAMRARGANVTDLIVLVVAADDGVKPQTLEVINRAQMTKTPMIVAVNKIDLPDADLEKTKRELAEAGIQPEEWGGKYIFVPISAKQNIGVDKLLDTILLTAEIESFRANPKGQTVGTVIESNLSKTQGPIVTVLVQNGMLQVGDFVAVGAAYGRIRTMRDQGGKSIKYAKLSSPARIAGLSTLTEVGDILLKYETLPEAQIKANRALQARNAKRLAYKTGITGDEENQQLRLILKTDTNGSLEAIQQEFSKLENKDVEIKIITQGVGDINESDILAGESSKATVIGFHNKMLPAASRLAKQKQVQVDLYQIIYELTEDVTSAILKMVIPEVEYITAGLAKILAIFATEKNSMIIGGKVKEGKLIKGKKLQIIRVKETVGEGKIVQLQHNKEDVKEVTLGSEFGAKITTPIKLEKGDILRLVEEKIKERKLRKKE
ncbi:MAG: translation initiation factor IF-2 [Candidatus Doudnabacteria bacterium CG10_big_fil_rev_8_21_14_0_10_41_10]|uniref:Translation initiation factor IF-2 n=1 Tax=Candidatus Doudnabacteria bacterium CG10_big_fil_rev_8_21_14_0_10_41_10 TaxID=1974551 RepID=A0A2H0VC64_9BACT|nr:MAG: translation initiation factor IF-2 [Candidatus Doudnabacteria bacterium CG10_big_fil_rev_8_21_14_0_10_41_10]